jgi:hypothetical protein
LIIQNYHEHIHQTLTPSRFRFNALRKDNSTFKAEMDIIPFPWRGEMLAFTFVREVK